MANLLYVTCNVRSQDSSRILSEILGKKVIDILPAEVGGKYLQTIARTLATGRMQVFEYELDFPQGARHYEARIVVSGENEGMTVVRDITEGKKNEQELRKKEEQLFLILLSLPMAFYIAQPLDTYGGTWVREQIERIAGFSPEQFLADRDLWAKRLHPEDRRMVLEEFGGIHESGKISIDYRWQVADGSYHWFHDEAVLVRDGSGEPREIIGSRLDISDRMHSHEELLLTQHSVDHNATPIVWLTPERHIVYANRAACEMSGYSQEEILLSSKGLLHPQGSSEYWDAYYPLLKKEGKASFELEIRKKDGSLIPVMGFGTFLNYLGQEYVIFSIIDLSGRKEMEQKLRQAQKMEAIGNLAGGIAHDFNNIITAVSGYADLAAMQLDANSTVQKDIEEIRIAADRAKSLVNQILTFSRRGEQEKQPLQLELIVKEALKLLRSTVPRTIELKQNIQHDCGLVNADPTQMHQVVMNLCINAYHAMREKGGTLTVSLQPGGVEADAGTPLKQREFLLLEVNDTGHGMEGETIQKIFEPYFTTKKTGEGTGLGLSVVHGIVKDHGGLIRVESESGVGSTFRIYLPLLERDNEKARVASSG